MFLFRVLEILSIVIGLYFIVSQVVRPIAAGTRVLPVLRRRSASDLEKANEDILAAEREIELQERRAEAAEIRSKLRNQ